MSEAIATKLDEARKLIEKGWCQHVNALDAHGYEVEPDDNAAACFCVYGALSKVVDWDFDEQDRVARPLREAAGAYALDEWSDAPERTQAEVVEAFRKAAELARREA